jgi:uncharacterized protein (DUF433 family)
MGMIPGDVITSNPGILGGTPVFTGTRVPVHSVWAHLEAGDTLDHFLDGFPGVSREQAEAVLRTRVRWVRSPESC